MKNLHFSIIVVCFAASFSLAATAQEYSRNGRACIEELCLGDGLQALANIQWDTAMSTSGDGASASRSVGRGETNSTAARYRGNTDGIVGYLADGRFDNGALAGMGNIAAACETQTMQGSYTTASGNPTSVIVSMVAVPDDLSSHRWEVRIISRKIPAVGTAEQAQSAKKSLEQRYADFTSRGRMLSGATDMFQENNYSGFQYTLRAPAVPNEPNLLKQHPDCGGSGGGTVSLD
jgi:hypothetical protein